MGLAVAALVSAIQSANAQKAAPAPQPALGAAALVPPTAAPVVFASPVAQSNAGGDILATGPGRPKKCLVVHKKVVPIRMEPRRLGKLIGFLKTGEHVEMLAFQGAWGQHKFKDDKSGEVRLGWSQMFNKDAMDFIRPLFGDTGAAPLISPELVVRPELPMWPAVGAQQSQAPKSTFDTKADSHLRYGLSVAGLDADAMLKEIVSIDEQKARDAMNEKLDKAQHGKCFWQTTPLQPEDIREPLPFVVVTKPFLPVRELTTGASRFLGALSCGRSFMLLAMVWDVQPWGRLEYSDHKNQKVLGWVALYERTHGDLAVPEGTPIDQYNNTEQMELVHQRAIRDVANRASADMAARAVERVAALKAMPRYNWDQRPICNPWDQDPSWLHRRLLLQPLGSLEVPPIFASRRGPRHFSRVCVMGAHHCCTNALGRELGRFFDVEVLNGEYGDDFGKEKRSPIWKHRIFNQPPPVPAGTLCICLIKDPAFWLKSMVRKVPTSFYHVRPLSRNPDTDELMDAYASKEEMNEAKPDDILQAVEFDSVIYKDALEVWRATVDSYFKEEVFPPETTVVLRCEDFLFRFDEVIRALALRGLNHKAKMDGPMSPLDTPAKGHMNVRSRGRNEALSFYSDENNRHDDLSRKAFARLTMMRGTNTMVGPLGYGDQGCVSWVP